MNSDAVLDQQAVHFTGRFPGRPVENKMLPPCNYRMTTGCQNSFRVPVAVDLDTEFLWHTRRQLLPGSLKQQIAFAIQDADMGRHEIQLVELMTGDQECRAILLL